MKLYYDFHIHSCLSPCAEDDMTPFNIANLGALCGLNAMALTDHNSCGNLTPFFKACEQNGIIPLGGMELTTAEEIHLICLFAALTEAKAFWQEVKTHMQPIKNRPKIFGNQLYTDENDDVTSVEENLLIPATDLDLESAAELVKSYGGVAYPAHVDRESNGIIAILGDLPATPVFTSCEFNDKNNIISYTEKYPALKNLRKLACSDAHRLESMREAESFLECEGTAESIIELLKRQSA